MKDFVVLNFIIIFVITKFWRWSYLITTNTSWERAYTIIQMHANGTVIFQWTMHITERINIRQSKPFNSMWKVFPCLVCWESERSHTMHDTPGVYRLSRVISSITKLDNERTQLSPIELFDVNLVMSSIKWLTNMIVIFWYWHLHLEYYTRMGRYLGPGTRSTYQLPVCTLMIMGGSVYRKQAFTLRVI